MLDFGLAKERIPAGDVLSKDDLANLDTGTAFPAMSLETGRHVIVGTAPYMSPEQAAGDRMVDRRTDIWAFGCVVYEMLTGVRPFDGDSVATTIRAIQSLDPDWSRLPADTPDSVRRLLARCLEKDADRRLRDAADVHLEIEATLVPGAAPEPIVNPWPRLSTLVVAAVALPTVVIGIAVAWWFTTNKTEVDIPGRIAPAFDVSPTPMTVPVPAEVSIPPMLTMVTRTLALSPDGRNLVFATWSAAEDNAQFYIRFVGDSTPRPIHTGAGRLDVGAGQGGNAAPPLFFSPDGQWLAFSLYGEGLFKMRVAGGEPILLTDQFSWSGRSAGAWGPDGTIVVGNFGGGLVKIPEGGGDPVPLTEPVDGTHSQPVFLPGGRVLLYTSLNYARTRIETLDLETGEQSVLLDKASDPHYVETGHLVFLRGSSLMAALFDPEAVQLLGEPVVVRKDIAYNAVMQFGHVDVSPGGTLAYIEADAMRPRRPLLRVYRDGTSEPLAPDKRGYAGVRLSRDGRRLTGVLDDDNMSVFVAETERFFALPLPVAGPAGSPLMSPDGSRLAFAIAADGPYNLYMAPRDRPQDAERLTTASATQCLSSWSPDGRYLTYWQFDPKGEPRGTCQFIDLEGDRTPQLLHARNATCGEFSPDGQWIAFTEGVLSQARAEVFVERFPGGGDRRQVSTDRGSHVRWSPDTDELFYRRGNEFYAVDVETEPELHIGEPRLLFEQPMWDHGLSCHVSYGIGPGAEWFLTPGPDETPPPEEIRVVLGWGQELIERVGQ